MIYQRRALQRRLDELRGVMDDKAVDDLAARLNRADRHRVAAMWELVVLHGLSKCGHLQNEVALASRRRPDVLFERDSLRLTADITAVSDEGLDDNNPYHELSELIEDAKKKLKLPIGGLDLRVRAKDETTKRGTRTVLLLPPRGTLQAFVNEVIVPQLRDQIAAEAFPLQVAIDDQDISLDITIDPRRSPYSSGGFGAYDVPRIKDKNPLFNALKAKAAQLRAADGITGVIVGDGDCVALSVRSANRRQVSTKQIVDEYFRQFSSIDFVLLLSVREIGRGRASVLQNEAYPFFRQGFHADTQLGTLFETMLSHFPKPAMMPNNGALRAREDDYGLGHHGGYGMSGSNVVRLGLREFTEIFAGLRSLDDNGAKNVEAARKLLQEPSRISGIVRHNLMQGRLPESVEVIKTDEDESDDWVEIRFGEVDPAIAPLR